MYKLIDDDTMREIRIGETIEKGANRLTVIAVIFNMVMLKEGSYERWHEPKFINCHIVEVKG
jgi:hypothetical protein